MRARSTYVSGLRQYGPLYIVRCGWCTTTIRETPHLVDVVSHGLCPSCAETFASDGLANAAAPMRAVHGVIERLRAEFMEMPGLRLTEPQVRRLCGVEQSLCQLMLDSLVNAKFLCRKSDGAYSRLSEGDVPRRRPAKAALAIDRCVVIGS